MTNIWMEATTEATNGTRSFEVWTDQFTALPPATSPSLACVEEFSEQEGSCSRKHSQLLKRE